MRNQSYRAKAKSLVQPKVLKEQRMRRKGYNQAYQEKLEQNSDLREQRRATIRAAQA